MKRKQRGLLWVVLVGICVTAAVVPHASGTRAEQAPAIEEQMPISRRLLSHVCGRSPSMIRKGQHFFPESVASGDPRPDSIVFWTRVVDEHSWGTDLPVCLLVFKKGLPPRLVANRLVLAKAENDYCVKVKVENLRPNTRYYYTFVYQGRGRAWLSKLGRTKTAPSPGTDVPVKFALVNCQYYNGRYYNSYLKLLLDHSRDLDFVLHVGDIIYETSGGPNAPPERTVEFSDPAGAIPLGDAENPFFGAASLSNYRDVYKTLRSDPVFQRLLENVPIIVMWDDHEYSDDCHGATATYFGGRKNEEDIIRRKNSERAFLEYVPIDRGLDASGKLDITDDILYPNAQIYRDFRFGTNLHLVLTDYRSYRPDHLIPEDAFPGTIVMDKATLEAVLTPPVYDFLKDNFDPYFDVETDPVLQGALIAILTQLYQMENPFLSEPEAFLKAQQVVAGNVSATYINALFAALGYPEPFDESILALLDRGLSYLYLGKQNLYGSNGSRYVVVKDTYDLLSGFLYAVSLGASEDAFGPAQETWVKNTLAGSTATWKILGNSVSATPMILDFTNPLIASLLPEDFPDAYRTRLLVSVEQWDGFPNKRGELIGLLAGIPNALILSGDIHASFVADHGNSVFEFTGTAVSSRVLQDEVMDNVMEDPSLAQVQGIEQLVQMLDVLLQVSSLDPEVSPAKIVYNNTSSNGFVVVEADLEDLTATYYHIATGEVNNCYYDRPEELDSLFETTAFKVQGGELTQIAP